MMARPEILGILHNTGFPEDAQKGRLLFRISLADGRLHHRTTGFAGAAYPALWRARDLVQRIISAFRV